VLNGFTGVLGPQDYLFLANNTYCYGINGGDPADGTILGDIFIQSQYVLFDRANKRIGFATPNCGGPSPATVTSSTSSSSSNPVTSSSSSTQTASTSSGQTSRSGAIVNNYPTTYRSGRSSATGGALTDHTNSGGKHRKPKFISEKKNMLKNKLNSLRKPKHLK